MTAQSRTKDVQTTKQQPFAPVAPLNDRQRKFLRTSRIIMPSGLWFSFPPCSLLNNVPSPRRGTWFECPETRRTECTWDYLQIDIVTWLFLLLGVWAYKQKQNVVLQFFFALWQLFWGWGCKDELFLLNLRLKSSRSVGCCVNSYKLFTFLCYF